MRMLFWSLILAAVSATAVAQPAGNTVLPPLPTPDLAEANRPSDFLRAAQGAVAAGRTGEAASALEMAQTRILARSVPLGQTFNPSDNPTIVQITQARQALAMNDRAACLQAIQAAIASAAIQGF